MWMILQLIWRSFDNKFLTSGTRSVYGGQLHVILRSSGLFMCRPTASRNLLLVRCRSTENKKYKQNNNHHFLSSKYEHVVGYILMHYSHHASKRAAL